MKLIVDTNVFISGVFFSGAPHQILDAWRHGAITFLISPQILAEYQATGHRLAKQFVGVDLEPWLELLATNAIVVDAPNLPNPVCSDPDDDKFLACALSGRCKCIVSGDKALLATSGFWGISVLTPRAFVERHLK